MYQGSSHVKFGQPITDNYQRQQPQLPRSVQVLNPRFEVPSGVHLPTMRYSAPEAHTSLGYPIQQGNSLYNVPQPEIQQRQAIELKNIELPRGVYQVPVENKEIGNSFKISNGINDFYGIEQPSVYDRTILSNKQSRLRQFGDPLRGDLPIKPRGGDLWQISASPATDLQRGAINILAGDYNEQQSSLDDLIRSSSGASRPW